MISVGLLSRGAGRGIPARGIGLFPEQHGPDHRLREVLKQYYLQLAFDRESRQLYVADAKNLSVFDAMGRMTRQVPLFGSNAAPNQVLVHPDGLKMAVVTRAAVHWIELPPPK